MRYTWLDAYLMAKPAVTKDFKKEWNWIRYFIGGKMFAAVLLNTDGKPYYINLKLKPVEGDLLRQQYEDIVPGYYSNKQHWNSIKPDGAVPDDLLKEMKNCKNSIETEKQSKAPVKIKNEAIEQKTNQYNNAKTSFETLFEVYKDKYSSDKDKIANYNKQKSEVLI